MPKTTTNSSTAGNLYQARMGPNSNTKTKKTHNLDAQMSSNYFEKKIRCYTMVKMQKWHCLRCLCYGLGLGVRVGVGVGQIMSYLHSKWQLSEWHLMKVVMHKTSSIFMTCVMLWLWRCHVSFMHTPSSKVLPITHILSFNKAVVGWGCKPALCVHWTTGSVKTLTRATHVEHTHCSLSETQTYSTFYREFWDHNGADINLLTLSSANNVHTIMYHQKRDINIIKSISGLSPVYFILRHPPIS